MIMKLPSSRSVAVGTIFVLVCSNMGQAQLVPIFDWVLSLFGAYEEPPFTFVRNVTESIEERIYPARKWICTEEFLVPEVKDTRRSGMFMRLHKYMQGENELDHKIEMTVPVVTKVDHRNGNLYSYEMCFFIPEEFQRNPPRPQNRKVHVVSFPELHVYSRRFGGYSTQELEEEQMLSLLSALRNESIPYFEQSQGPRATHFISGYDSPTKFWNRRNEVWILGKDNKPLPVYLTSSE